MLLIRTYIIYYYKFAIAELEEFKSNQSILLNLYAWYRSQFSYLSYFISSKSILGCVECIKDLKRRTLSSIAIIHNQLRCEHAYLDELKDLLLIKEKLIALNSYYNFIIKYNISKDHRENATYPKHVKGYITVFLNNIQELAIRILPYPLVKVIDEIYVSQ